MGDGCPVDGGELVVEECVELGGKFGIGSFPCGLLGTTGLDNLAELGAASLVESLDVVIDYPGILGIGTEAAKSAPDALRGCPWVEH